MARTPLPEGTRIPDTLPSSADANPFIEIARRAEAVRAAGRQVVVVQGLGFVGAAMAAVVANASDAAGQAKHFVIGVDLDSPSGRTKIDAINSGVAPIVAEDPKIGEYVERGALRRANLVATADVRAYELADVVVVDIQLDTEERTFATADAVRVNLEPFVAAMRVIGERIRPTTLVLVETTVPPGATERVVFPVIQEEFARRGITVEPLVAHSYERVMPGRAYIDSIERFWRTYAGVTDAAADAAERFLSSIVAVSDFPLRRLSSPRASEIAKVLENSYRAANIAFIHEWTRAAEAVGVNLFDVVSSIAVRKGTHDNIRRPGFGVGGYCLTKDGYLAQWGLRHLLGADVSLDTTLRALAINHGMPMHSFDLVAQHVPALRGATILVCGISYLNDVADTRYSPTNDFCARALDAGARVLAHDPYVTSWAEHPGLERPELASGVASADAVVLAVRHQQYLTTDWSRFDWRDGALLLDTQDIVPDAMAASLRRRGVLVVGVGKGHWDRSART